MRIKPPPRNERYNTPWFYDEGSGMLFRLYAGALQRALPQEDRATPVEGSVRDAYFDAAFGGGEVSAARLEGMTRGLRRLFVELWRSSKHVRAVVVPRSDIGMNPFTVTAALLEGAEDPAWAASVTTFDAERAVDEEAGEYELVLRLIGRAVRAWRELEPSDEVIDITILADLLMTEEAPGALLDALRAHGILHLDFELNFGGDWDDTQDLAEE